MVGREGRTRKIAAFVTLLLAAPVALGGVGGANPATNLLTDTLHTVCDADPTAGHCPGLDSGWVANYDGPADGTVFKDDAQDIAAGPDGSTVFVAGESPGEREYCDSSICFPLSDYATVAYDGATGEEVWTARYGPSGALSPSAVGVSPDGQTVFVTGSHLADHQNSGEFSFDFATVAYNASTGEEIWATGYDGTGGDDIPQALEVSPDGSMVYVTGGSWGNSFDYATVAYDTGSGGEAWAVRYDGPSGGEDRSAALGVSSDGSKIVVTGASSNNDGGQDYATLAYDGSTGQTLWIERFEDGSQSNTDGATALAIGPGDSSVYVTGSSLGDYATVAYDLDSGEEKWTARYGQGDGPDTPNALDVGPDGATVFVTGESQLTDEIESSDYATLAYTSDGVELWSARYDGQGEDVDVATALGVSVDGSTLYVTGTTATGPDDRAFTTIAYEATSGIGFSLAQHGEGQDNHARALSVGPDETVYVTGQGAGSSSPVFRTIAYDVEIVPDVP